ncbi:hypothetical protein BKA63DRAFT_143708 [Paraphoma chrysanthemicola]|nr:hypothetical protein BKA63DRAFT_143708 [Paraphoma chrysanthemicola]
MFLTQVLAILFSLGNVAQADYNNDQAHDALIVLQDIPRDLATDFCQEYAGHHEYKSTTTCTVAGYPITSTTTIVPTSCDYGTTPYHPVTATGTAQDNSAPLWISTISSTTTITYTTTSTIYVSEAYPTLYKRSAKNLPHRATWCPDYDLPCRLVQYTSPVIEAACEEYLNYGAYQVYVVTSTYTVYPTKTETATASECTSEGGYSAPTDVWYDEPGYETPVAPSSVYEVPSYENAADGVPSSAYDEPAYGVPTPTYEEAAYEPAYDDPAPEYNAPAPLPGYDDAVSSLSYLDNYAKPENEHDYESDKPYSGGGHGYSSEGSDGAYDDGENYENKGQEEPYFDSHDEYSDDSEPYGSGGEEYGGDDDRYDVGAGEYEGYPQHEEFYGEGDSHSGEEQPSDDWDNMVAGMDPEYVDAVDSDDSVYYV